MWIQGVNDEQIGLPCAFIDTVLIKFYEIICGLVASSRVSGYFCWFRSRLRPLFSFWSPARVCFSCQFMRTMYEFPWRKWLLCSSEKRNEVLCIRGPPKQHSSPYPAITRRCHRSIYVTGSVRLNWTWLLWKRIVVMLQIIPPPPSPLHLRVNSVLLAGNNTSIAQYLLHALAWKQNMNNNKY